MSPTPPCAVGDLVQDEYWPPEPCVVLAVTYIPEPTEKEKRFKELFGYMLRDEFPHWVIAYDQKRKGHLSDMGWPCVRVDLDTQGRMIHCTPAWGHAEEHLSIVGHTDDFVPISKAVDVEEVFEIEDWTQGELFA